MSFGHPFYKSTHQYQTVAKRELIGLKAEKADNRVNTSWIWTSYASRSCKAQRLHFLKNRKRAPDSSAGSI